jgi:hypothetical protein
MCLCVCVCVRICACVRACWMQIVQHGGGPRAEASPMDTSHHHMDLLPSYVTAGVKHCLCSHTACSVPFAPFLRRSKASYIANLCLAASSVPQVPPTQRGRYRSLHDPLGFTAFLSPGEGCALILLSRRSRIVFKRELADKSPASDIASERCGMY